METEKKMISEYIDVTLQTGDHLLDKFLSAWDSVPEEFRGSAKLYDDEIAYFRPETDAEFNSRLHKDKIDAEKKAELLALKNNNHLLSELSGTIGAINSTWETMSTGNSVSLGASVPMPDGRIASVQITVTAREQTKSVD